MNWYQWIDECASKVSVATIAKAQGQLLLNVKADLASAVGKNIELDINELIYMKVAVATIATIAQGHLLFKP